MTTTRTARRAAITGLAIASALILGMTATTWNPYTRALDAQVEQTISSPAPAGMDHAPILLGGYWDEVPMELGDALAEGGSPDATDRDWEACQVHWDADWTAVRCPDGYSESWAHTY
jgi:hypothetical protein